MDSCVRDYIGGVSQENTDLVGDALEAVPKIGKA
jgi:hypothetical protein